MLALPISSSTARCRTPTSRGCTAASGWVPAAAYGVFRTSLLVGRIVGFGYELLASRALSCSRCGGAG